MITFLIYINAIVFISLSMLHVYWAFGGEIEMDKVIPVIEGKELAFKPPAAATLLVAAGLLGFAAVMLANLGYFDTFISKKWINYVTWAIGILFLVRAIGDFKYVGFFKKVYNSPFSTLDTRYYSPLCLVIALIAILIAIRV